MASLRARAALVAVTGLVVSTLPASSWGGGTVLPGFSPLRLTGSTLELGARRTYTWTRSFLPVSVRAAGEPLAGPFDLIVSRGGSDLLLAPDDVTVEQASEHDVTIRARGSREEMAVEVTTRVEYDGVAMCLLRLTTRRPTTISHVELRTAVARRPATRMMTWDAATHRKRLRALFVSEPRYRGRFLNVVALSNGSQSFWWFADDADRWLSNPDNTSQIESTESSTVIRQRIRIGALSADQPVEIRFNFLATPIRDGAPWRRRDHRVARRVTAEEGAVAGLQLWWPDALPHEALPYPDYPSATASEIPAQDRRLYPGKAGVRSVLDRARDMGILRLPYFSAHAPSLYDPAVRARRREWEVQPPYVLRPGADAPYTSSIGRPWLSLRGPGLIAHLVDRVGELIDEMGIGGLYFDQGAVIDSRNLDHGAWQDTKGEVHPSLDILATRRYFKQLAELFHRKGKPGILVVHNSSVPIVPAYTFVTAMVQGEEFVVDLRNLDYIGSVPLDLVRAQYAPGQYGIGSIWLEELWSPGLPGTPIARYPNLKAWVSSSDYRAAWRNYMALVLLHDVTPWSLALLADRERVYRVYDSFDVADATFIGYWDDPVDVNAQDGVVASLYRGQDRARALVVATNLTDRPRVLSIRKACAILRQTCSSPPQYRVDGEGPWSPVVQDMVVTSIGARDYRLVELRLMGERHDERPGTR